MRIAAFLTFFSVVAFFQAGSARANDASADAVECIPMSYVTCLHDILADEFQAKGITIEQEKDFGVYEYTIGSYAKPSSNSCAQSSNAMNRVFVWEAVSAKGSPLHMEAVVFFDLSIEANYDNEGNLAGTIAKHQLHRSARGTEFPMLVGGNSTTRKILVEIKGGEKAKRCEPLCPDCTFQ